MSNWVGVIASKNGRGLAEFSELVIFPLHCMMPSSCCCLQADVGDTSHKKHEAMEKVRFYRDKITEIQGIISVLQANVRLQNDKVEAAKEAAEKVCPRMNTERSHQSIESEVRKLRRRIDQELPDKSEQVEVEKEFFVAKNRFRDTKSAVKNEKKSLKVIFSLCCNAVRMLAC